MVYQIDFGGFIILRGDVFHSRHYGSKNNLRLHGVVEVPQDHVDLEEDTLYFITNYLRLRDSNQIANHPWQDYEHVKLGEEVEAVDTILLTSTGLDKKVKKYVLQNTEKNLRRYFPGGSMLQALEIKGREKMTVEDQDNMKTELKRRYEL